MIGKAVGTEPNSTELFPRCLKKDCDNTLGVLLVQYGNIIGRMSLLSGCRMLFKMVLMSHLLLNKAF